MCFILGIGMCFPGVCRQNAPKCLFVFQHGRCEPVLKGILELCFPEFVKFYMECNNSVFLNKQEFGSGEALKLVRAVVNVLSHFCF